MSDLRLVNVTAEGQAPVLLYSDRSGGIRDVLLDDFDLNLSAGPLTPLYGGNLDLRPVDPVEHGIVRYDAAGFKAENIGGLDMRNLHLRWNSAVPDFFRPGLQVRR